ncbi:hypothetical protein BNATCHR2115 (nucleomorph) [Bigelowiella natans]|uniref:Uncharacterized protein n=1 Tax=Bigelowiella natans TaxID=227086 RepID=Q3LW31_BIGNA|nr:hypothetical protein BNATCHR2115 [Bigelowiella natans]ABA27334.1 hypothetical protein [Bigelowiella natans]
MNDLNSKIPGYLKKIPWYSKQDNNKNTHIFKNFYKTYTLPKYVGTIREKSTNDQKNKNIKITPFFNLLNHYTFKKTKVYKSNKQLIAFRSFLNVKSLNNNHYKMRKFIHTTPLEKKKNKLQYNKTPLLFIKKLRFLYAPIHNS